MPNQKRLLDVGNCGPDYGALTDVLADNFNVRLSQAYGLDDALELLGREPFDLVTVNRLMDRDGSSGLEIIKAIKSDDQFKSIPVMLITNYPEYQELAIAAGAEPGFGKSRLREPATVDLFRAYLA